MALCNFVEDGIIAESARWGDAHAPYTGDVSVITLNDHWYNARDYVYRLMAGNAKKLVIACRQSAISSWPLYPMIDPPDFSQEGGSITNGFPLSMTNEAGDIWYTLDGTDPRAVGGATNGSATLYTGPISLTSSTTVKARCLSGNIWSALHEAAFHVTEPTGGVRITEIMYNPIDGDDYEFLELKNTGMFTTNISGWYLTNAVHCTFPGGTELAPGEYYVVANKASSFSSRYGFAPDLEYGGKLDNAGETNELRDAGGNLVLSVPYDDHSPWPEDADGNGYSLVIMDPDASPTNPANWRASAWTNGSPGADDLFYKHLTNSRPAVSSGGPQMYFTGASVPLSGNTSDDGLPTGTLSYTWSKASGPGDVTFGSSTTLVTTAVFTNVGTYVLQLETSDGLLMSTSHSQVIVVTDPVTNGMVCWLRSDTGITTNTSGCVTNWTVKAGETEASQTDSDCAPLYKYLAQRGTPGLYFDGTNDVLDLGSSTNLGTGGPWSNRTWALVFRTGDDVDSRQVLYEQGGTNSGMNIYIENGHLQMGAWNMTSNDATTPWGPVWLTKAVARDAQYTVQFVFDQGTNMLEGIVNEESIGEASGIGNLYGEADGTALGGIAGWTRFADNETASAGTDYFQGWIFETLLLAQDENFSDYLRTRSGADVAGFLNGGDGVNGSTGVSTNAAPADAAPLPDENNCSLNIGLQIDSYICLSNTVQMQLYVNLSEDETPGSLTVWCQGGEDHIQVSPSLEWSMGISKGYWSFPETFSVKGIKVSDTETDVWLRVSYQSGTKLCRGSVRTTVLKVDMLKPQCKVSGQSVPVGSIIHWTFNSASPGICEVGCWARTNPDGGDIRNFISGKITWTIDSISGSTLSWHNNQVSLLEPLDGIWYEIPKYTGLPTSNSEFGDKNASFTVIGLGCGDNGKAKIFFSRDQKNHPDPASGVTPNWYYYWSQTSADYGTHEYRAGSRSCCVYEDSAWRCFIEDDATGPLSLHNVRTDQDFVYSSINAFAYAARHEEQHRLNSSSALNWGNSNRVASLDTDNDGLRDENEGTFVSGRPYVVQYFPTYDDDWGYGSGFDDSEDACMWQQAWPVATAYDSVDWAMPGRQYGPGYTAP